MESTALLYTTMTTIAARQQCSTLAACRFNFYLNGGAQQWSAGWLACLYSMTGAVENASHAAQCVTTTARVVIPRSTQSQGSSSSSSSSTRLISSNWKLKAQFCFYRGCIDTYSVRFGLRRRTFLPCFGRRWQATVSRKSVPKKINKRHMCDGTQLLSH